MIQEIVKNEVLMAKDYSIEQFYNQYDLINIPIYQRSYSWDEKNIKVFIKDINDNDNYYIGNIMSNKIEETSIDIIDGQQRMISLFLILCSLKNDFGINIEYSINTNNGRKLKLEERSPVGQSLILEDIFNNNIPNNLNKKSEVIVYKKLKKIISDLVSNMDMFFEKILKLKIVEIKFENDGYDAHNVFVNLNTKGKQLEDIDVLKSQVLKYSSSSNLQKKIVKENWYEMLQMFNPSDYQRYVDIYFDVNYDRASNQSRLSVFLERLSDEITTKDFFEKFIDNNVDTCSFCASCSAIFKHNLTDIKLKISDSGYSFDSLNTIVNAYEKIKFKQFDIVLTTLLYFKNDENRNYFSRNFDYIYKFLVFVYMNQLIMSLKGTSPSKYGDNLKKLAKKLYADSNKKQVIKDILNLLPNFVNGPELLKKELEKIEVDGKSKKMNLTTTRLIIQAAYGNYTSDLKLEHFLNQSSTEPSRYLLGNCIPVKIDNYGSIDMFSKLQKYNNNRSTEYFIDDFLKLGINNNNYEIKITERTEDIASKFVNKYVEIYNELVN